MSVSKAQVDRLGERLRGGRVSEEDIRLLDAHRRSFGDAYQEVLLGLRGHGLSPTGRPAKSTASIIDKLRRESIRLSQMQDIAGCRIVTESSAAQDEVVARIADVFQDVKVVDRRAAPSNSYRAVHCIVTVGKLSIEIQVRSPLQHLWAELSERASDVIDPDLKYGGGPEQWRVELELASKHVAAFERYERSVATVTALYEEWFVVAHDLEAACKEVLSGNPEDEVGKAARVELKRTQKKLARAGKERDEGLADLEASRHDLVNSLNGLIHRLNAIRRTP